MNSISSTATAPVQSTFTPPAASSPVRQGVKDLAKALHAEDLTAAKEAYARIVRTAPEGTKWPHGSPFESLGRALHAGDIGAAKDVMASAFQALRAARQPSMPVQPMPPQSIAVDPGSPGATLSVVA